MKKAISVLLILTTLLSCCVGFFACKPKDDDPTVVEGGNIKNNSTVVLNLENDSTISKAGLAKSDKVYDLSGAKSSAKWEVSKNKILTIDFDSKGLSDYKEISFWMLNDSDLNISFTVFFIMEDGEEVRISTTLSSQHSATNVISTKVQNITASPGWNEYKLALSEVEPLEDKSYAYVEPEDEKGEGYIDVKFDKSKIVGIKLDAHADNKLNRNDVNFYITSICANNVKTGTIRGHASNLSNIANAVCFYESSNAYLYNQNRYIYSYDEKSVLPGNNNNTTMVPVEILARHRGAEITANDKEAKLISFNYKGKSYTFKEGDEISFVGDERGFSAGVSLKENVIVFGDYVLIPMETAAEVFGYHLYFDQMGLAVFSDTDLKEKYLPPRHENYRTDLEAGMPAIYNIVQVIVFKNYTGAEIIEDMNTIHGEDAHTKLIVTQEHFDILKERLKTDPIYATWFNGYEATYAKGTSNYSSALPVFNLGDGRRLLTVSHRVTNQLLPYAFLYKMTGNEDYAVRVKKVMIAATKFTDNFLTGQKSWHPEHTLDTGVLMFGYSLAYDWCYDYLAKDKKDLATIENAMWEMGFGAYMGFGDLYEWWDDRTNLQKHNDEMLNDGDPATVTFSGTSLGQIFNIKDGAYYSKYEFDRYKWSNNWGGVCNGGLMVAALAFANVNTEFRAASEYLIDCMFFNFPCTLYVGYGPDGGYPEGVGYWSFGTTFSIDLFASLETAVGSDQGFPNAPGFRESFYFVNALSTTTCGIWNYHDAGLGRPSTERFFWFAHQTGDMNVARIRYNALTEGKYNIDVWDLMFYDPAVVTTDLQLDLDYCYYGIATAAFHSDWSDSALFCGLHGGANAAGHGQLDIGNFILEYGGTRFFRDLGSDYYNLSGYTGKVNYFGSPIRYWYYRNRAEGHNTLVINPTRVDTSNIKTYTQQGTNYDSLYSAVSDMLRFESGKTSALAVIDMACAYTDSVPVYYACSSCDYETPGICTYRTCDGKGNQMVLDQVGGKYVLKCVAKGCTSTVDAVCPECGATLVEKRNGIRGMYVRENRTTVVIQDEMWLKSPATKVMWMGHVPEGATVTISEDMQSALIKADGKTLLCQIVVPEGYTGTWRFEAQAADYLAETGLVMTPGEKSRDGWQKLVAISEGTNEIKLAVVCKLLSAGPHTYTWTDIENWTVDR